MIITTNTADHILEMIVASVNSQNTEVPITLLVDGMLVTGILVSGAKYFEHYVTLFPLTNESPVKIGDTAYATDVKVRVEIDHYKNLEGDVHSDAVYVHLRDAKFHYSNDDDLTARKGVMWRGMLEKVSGFHFPVNQFATKPVNPKDVR